MTMDVIRQKLRLTYIWFFLIRLGKLIRTASPEANLLALLSISILSFKIFVLNSFPQMFFGAHQFGVIVEAILASVVASYIFYMIVVHIKEQKEKSTVNPYISKHTNRIVDDSSAQLRQISKISGISLDFDSLDKGLLLTALSKIPPYSDAPLTLAPTNKSGNWLQYLNHYINHSRISIKRILDQLLFLDAKLVALIAAIDDCSLYSHIDFAQKIKLENEDLAIYCDSFYEYFALCKSLKIYAQTLPVTD